MLSFVIFNNVNEVETSANIDYDVLENFEQELDNESAVLVDSISEYDKETSPNANVNSENIFVGSDDENNLDDLDINKKIDESCSE